MKAKRSSSQGALAVEPESKDLPTDNHSDLRFRIGQIAEYAKEWFGVPVPIGDVNLILEPTHRLFGVFDKSTDNDDVKIINHWFSFSKKSEVVIWGDGRDDGKVAASLVHSKVLDKDFQTSACSLAWSIEAEQKAQKMLRGLIKEHLFKIYFLTGIFPETSKRSGVTYLFRRLRPTVALRPDRKGGMSILASLCLHPIGYYEGTWAGAMCPTDDVIAHLMLMRSDEHYYWRKANQIPPSRPEAGI